MKRNRYNQRILIVCEGTTEENYIKELKVSIPRCHQNAIDIKVVNNQGGSVGSLIKEAITRKRKAIREQNRYNEVWIFFDNDKCENLEEEFKKINKEGFKIAYSSISIEHWFILHFQNCGAVFLNGDQAQTYLTKLWPEYHKTKIKHYSLLYSKLDTAIQRAAQLNLKAIKNYEEYESNPYFTIPSLIDKFRSLK